ncbi:MAG: hypothetical protein CL760_00980 [Chloroflexi bacterium]|nr:hypothetical protein [Chloroflexota bacterium]|tara:strand:- start:47453 stop:47854 length:402 start_codon:yes stop_codon:yes gene_type:complete
MLTLSELYKQLSETQDFTRKNTMTIVEDSIEVVFEDLPDFPVRVIVDSNGIHCWTVLASIEDIQEDKIDELNATLLEANGRTSLSNFSTLDGLYCLNGDLSSESILKNIVLELDTLITVTEDAIEKIFLNYIN